MRGERGEVSRLREGVEFLLYFYSEYLDRSLFFFTSVNAHQQSFFRIRGFLLTRSGFEFLERSRSEVGEQQQSFHFFSLPTTFCSIGRRGRGRPGPPLFFSFLDLERGRKDGIWPQCQQQQQWPPRGVPKTAEARRERWRRIDGGDLDLDLRGTFFFFFLIPAAPAVPPHLHLGRALRHDGGLLSVETHRRGRIWTGLRRRGPLQQQQ